MRNRENKTVRREQDVVRFYMEADVKKSLKLYALENDTTIQEIFENYAKQLLQAKGIGINE